MAALLPRFTIDFDGDTPTADLLRLCAGAITFTAEFLRLPSATGQASQLVISSTAAERLADVLSAVEQMLWFVASVENRADPRTREGERP
jgi:hypothetical protein